MTSRSLVVVGVAIGLAVILLGWWSLHPNGKSSLLRQPMLEGNARGESGEIVGDHGDIPSQGTEARSQSVQSELRKVAPLIGLDDLAAARHLARGFHRLYELSSFFDITSVKREAYAALAADGPSLDLAARALTDSVFARAAFGEDQAMVRVFAVEALTYAYEKAGDERLESTLASLVDTLTASGVQANGQYKDVEQLARAVFRRHDGDDGLASFGWPDARAPLPLQRAVLIALYLEQGDKPEFDALLAARFPDLKETSL